MVGVTSLSAHVDPAQVVQLLNEIFSSFDILVERHRLEKIKTIGDAYMVVGGMSECLRPDHPEAFVELATNLHEEVKRLNYQYKAIRVRIGISTGPVIAGVIGYKKFAFDIWGETVNLASRLESTAEAGRIQVSESTCERLKGMYQIERRP